MKLTTAIVCVALLAAPSLALAHSTAKSGTPRDGETLTTAPAVVRLVFDGPMRVTALTLTGPAGTVPLARTDAMKPVTTLVATPETEMGAGAWTLEWRGMGADGHVMQGTTRFTIAP